MIKILLWSLSFLFLCQYVFAQDSALISCGQKEVNDRYLKRNPAIGVLQEQIEARLRDYNLKKRTRPGDVLRVNEVVTLPVVVHIIHNNGPENISDAQVFTGIQHLNEAFANTGYYDPADGVNTQVQFCLAQRDPSGNVTNGITRAVSAIADDNSLKESLRWNPYCYINIWLVRDIPGGIVGYATLPSFHGHPNDGITMEANYFGSSQANGVVITHEMGHYLGLRHTFEGGCKNDDCTVDGDRVCDTPPDQSTAYVGCNTVLNSCSTDALSGFNSDMSDLKEDYMDYGYFQCMKVFTQGQADRMHWFIQNVRKSLLDCKSCLPPCPSPTVAGFTSSARSVSVGNTINFTNNSFNAPGGYRWYLDGILQSSARDFSYTFNHGGVFIVRLVALPNSPLCDSAVSSDTIRVTCPLAANFSPLHVSANVNQVINFTNSSVGAVQYQWLINRTLQGTGTNFSVSFPQPGMYVVKLRAIATNCVDSMEGVVTIDGDLQPPRDTCSQNTFISTIGGAGIEIPREIIETADGGYLVAGQTTSISGSHDALLLKLDSRGEMVWSKAFGGPGTETFQDVIATRDGNYLALGSRSIPGGDEIYVVKLDPLGNPIWAKSLGDGNRDINFGNEVIETNDDGFVVIGSCNSKPLFVKLDQDGNLIWNRVLQFLGSGMATEIVEVGNELIGVGYVHRSDATTYQDGFIIKLNNADGSIIWTKKVESESRSNRLSEIKYTNNGLVYTMVNSNTPVSGDPKLVIFKTDLDATLTNARRFDFSLPTPLSILMVSHPTVYGGMVMAFVGGASRPAHLALTDANGDVTWVRNFTPMPVQSVQKILSTDNGHILLSNAADDILLIKTNLSGLISNDPASGCNVTSSSGDGNDVAVQITLTPPGYWTSTDPVPMTATNISTGIRTDILPSQTLCRDSTRCEIPPDSCYLGSFAKTYGTTDSTGSFYDMIETNDDHLLTMGAINIGSSNGWLSKVDANGSVAWNKVFDANTGLVFRSGISTSDNAYLCISNYGGAGGTLLIKTDQSGNITWKKDLTQQGYNPRKIIEGLDGDYYLLGWHTVVFPIRQHVTLTRITRDGNLVWSRVFLSPDGVNVLGNSLVDDNDAVYIAGEYFMTGVTRMQGMAMRVSKTTAEITWSKYYRSAIDGGGFTQILRLDGQFLVNSPTSSSILKIDASGNIVSETSLQGPGTAFGHLLAIHNNKNIVGVNTPMTGNPHSLAVFQLDKDFNIQWARSYNQPPRNSAVSISARGSNIYIGSILQSVAPKWMNMITKLDSQGIISTCVPEPIALNKRAPAFVITDYSSAGLFDIQYNAGNADIPITSPAVVVGTAACGRPEVCALLDVTGADTLCKPGDTIVYYAKRSYGCLNKVRWQIDTVFAAIISSTDSTIHLQFKKAGALTLYGSLSLSCALLQDSIPIQIFHSPGTLNLGPDIQLCKIGTWPLNARSGFKSYLWQDGSTDSIFTVTDPGTYHVTVTGYCGNQLKDTVIVSLRPDIPFDLGPDLEVCDNDTLTLTAPAGYTNYYWSPGYRISNSYAPVVKVFPERDTVYSLVAEISPGCLVSDTIKIAVVESPSHFLADTAGICVGQQLILKATRDFVNYRWDNFQATSTITVSRPGFHVLEVTDTNGCTGLDTIRVIAKDCGKLLYFPNAFTPNNDRFNNEFKPVVSGRLLKFHLIIYNRLGAKVFESFDPAHGWNGIFNGTRQTTNTFAWTCTYRFEGADEVEKKEKGTVTLIR